MGIGVFIILLAIKAVLREIPYIQELRAWRKQNSGKLLFFYPTTKKEQQELETAILPLLPPDCLRVYYDGPALVGDVKRSVVRQLMRHYPQITVHKPTLSSITENGIHTETLIAGKTFSTASIEISTIQDKIEKILKTDAKRITNSY